MHVFGGADLRHPLEFLSDDIFPTARAQASHVVEDHDRTKGLVEPLRFELLPLAHELCLELQGSTVDKDKVKPNHGRSSLFLMIILDGLHKQRYLNPHGCIVVSQFWGRSDVDFKFMDPKYHRMILDQLSL